jgi:hypothetical protein
VEEEEHHSYSRQLSLGGYASCLRRT